MRMPWICYTGIRKTLFRMKEKGALNMILGAQLYTLRTYTQNERDLAYSLAEVAKMGYTTVQISAIGPQIPAKTVKRLCEEQGLSIVLTHTNPDRILWDTEAVIREHEIMECPYIGIGMMPERYRSPEWISHFAQDYRVPAQKIAASGKRLMYHNHSLEFGRFDGKLVLETLLEAFAPEEMGITLDTYWVQAAGADVCQWIRLLKDRIPCVHLKDMAVRGSESIMAPVMEGNMNFSAILQTLKEIGQTEFLLVEQDICQESPFTCLQKSYQNLTQLGYR